ncbi:TonB-dependent receptor [Erythrobacter litoralis]|uniref:TonB-dependent receptor n=1 Tax=Erythrobacter litoralis TaxID=39960 RepID=UPI00243566FD|nr:TonB-dependent siderophore receptor [Erythrobacter litoralis]
MLRNPHLTGAALALVLAAPAHAQSGAPAEDSQDTIIVTAQRENRTEVVAGGNVGVLGDKPAEDVPFTVRTFDESLILNQQPQTLGEVLENDPTVRTTLGFGIAGEQFVIRGFPLYGDDVGMNGLYGITPRQLVAPELYSGVQVLNGANAFLYGAAPGGTGIGGNVNLQLKRAGETPLTRATLGYTSDSHFGGSADIARRFGGDGQFGVRVNGVFRSGDVSIDDEFRETLATGAAVDWRSENVRVFADLAYQRIEVDRLRPQIGLAAGAIPAVPDADANYGQAFTNTELESLFGIARLEYDVADNALFYVTGGALESEEMGTYGSITVTDAVTGAASGGASIVPAEQSNQAIEAGLRAKIGSAVTQEFNFGTNVSWQEFRTAFDFRTNYATNIYDTPQVAFPTDVSFASGDLDDPLTSSRSRLMSAFVSDTVGFLDERVLIIGGLRLQEIEVRGFDVNSGAETSAYEESAVTPVAGLVVKPVAGLSLFANRIEGLQQGQRAPINGIDPDNPDGPVLPVSNANQVLPPFKSVQYEVGAKLALGMIDASVSAYQIEQPNAFLGPNEGQPGFLAFAPFGEQRNRGIEAFVSGEPTEGLRLILGGSVTDAELTNTPGGVNEGNTALGIPDYTINANAEWDLPFVPGVTLTGRVVHTGEQWVDQANTLELDPWTRVDLGARYVFAAGDTPVTLRFTVDNVANERYWSSAFTAFGSFGGQLLQGDPRTFKASISADF